jgi:hypothetical protein
MTSIEIEQLLDRHRDKFKRLLRTIAAEEEGPDPFSFSLARYGELEPAERLALVRRAGIIARDRVDEELRKRSAAWIVLVGDRVVADSKEIGPCPSADEVLAMGEREDRVAFLFEAPLVEEIPSTSQWAPVAANDAYPTVPLTIDGEALAADLDTGSHATFVNGKHLRHKVTTWFEGRHLGQAFHWTPGRVQFAVSAGGTRLEREVPTRFVHDWDESPFVRINAKRKALVGRDFMRAFGLRLRLSTPELATSIESGE